MAVIHKEHILSELTELYERILDGHVVIDGLDGTEYVEIDVTALAEYFGETILKVRHYR